jgi:hypothetical protein
MTEGYTLDELNANLQIEFDQTDPDEECVEDYIEALAQTAEKMDLEPIIKAEMQRRFEWAREDALARMERRNERPMSLV